MGLEIRPLTQADLEFAATILADAFRDGILVSHYFPVPEKRYGLLPDYMRLVIDVAFPLNHSLGLWEDGKLKSTALVLPPGNTSLSIVTILRALSSRKSLWDPGALLRYLNFSIANAKNHPKHDHWYLFIIGVTSSCQRRGLGRKIMSRIIGESEKSGHPIFLETCAPQNVPYYTSFGFEVTAELHPGIGSTPKTWCMSRSPNEKRMGG